MWCEEYSGAEPIHCKIGMYYCVIISGELKSDDDENREKMVVRDKRSEGPSVDVTGNTEMSLVNSGFIGANRTLSEGISVGDATIFIGPMKGVKILSTISTILRAREMYPSNFKSQ